MEFIKYTFTCDPIFCDALLEFTCRDGFDFPNGEIAMQCPCGRKMNYITTEQKEAPVEKVDNHYLTREFLETTLVQNKEQIAQLEKQAENNFNLFKQANSQISRIISWMDENGWYNPNTDKEDILSELCDILEYTPKKEISFTAVMHFSGRIDLDLADAEDFDLTEFLSDAYVDINHGDVVIDDYELTEADEC